MLRTLTVCSPWEVRRLWAALAHGVSVKPCVIIVGPGKQYVTAAKSIVEWTLRHRHAGRTQ